MYNMDWIQDVWTSLFIIYWMHMILCIKISYWMSLSGNKHQTSYHFWLNWTEYQPMPDFWTDDIWHLLVPVRFYRLCPTDRHTSWRLYQQTVVWVSCHYKNAFSAWWSSTMWTSISSRQNVTCSRHEIAEQLFNWC